MQKCKKNDKMLRMGYDFIPLAIETGGRQAEVTEAFLCRLIDIAGCGDASDKARFHNYAAPRILMTHAIGVAKTEPALLCALGT